MMNNNLMNDLRDIVQDCNINFLIGAGLSSPYLSLLGNIEKLLTELSNMKEQEKVTKNQEKIIRASFYKEIFDKVIVKNIDLLKRLNEGRFNFSNGEEKNLYLGFIKYTNFIIIINEIFLNRRSTILSKQVNLFTTNFDIFLDVALEETRVEYNDGFNGHFNPVFNLSNFKRSFLKRTLHYDNIYELPGFNLMKLHGSLTWKKEKNKENIFFDKNLELVENIKKIQVPNEQLINIRGKDNEKEIDDLITQSKDRKIHSIIDEFITEYEKLSIINPTKEKFKETLLQRNHYELLRIYSTELEKENTVLFVMGFSFSDEHIRDITIRVANSNPTLKIYIFAYTDIEKENIKNKLIKKNNVKVLSPKDIPEELYRNKNNVLLCNKEELGLKNINFIFDAMLENIDGTR